MQVCLSLMPRCLPAPSQIDLPQQTGKRETVTTVSAAVPLRSCSIISGHRGYVLSALSLSLSHHQCAVTRPPMLAAGGRARHR